FKHFWGQCALQEYGGNSGCTDLSGSKVEYNLFQETPAYGECPVAVCNMTSTENIYIDSNVESELDNGNQRITGTTLDHETLLDVKGNTKAGSYYCDNVRLGTAPIAAANYSGMTIQNSYVSGNVLAPSCIETHAGTAGLPTFGSGL